MDNSDSLDLRTARDTLRFDARGSLISLRPIDDAELELIAPATTDRVFVVQYLDRNRRFRQLSADDAATITARREDDGELTTLRFTYQRLAGLELDVEVAVRAAEDDRFSRFSITLRNDAGLLITDVQFPWFVLPYRLGGSAGSERLLWPFGPGVLLRAPRPEDLAPDDPHTWQLRPENGDMLHYPGYTVAQFLAYFSDRCGLFVACEDTAGSIKQLKPVHSAPGLRLGIAHNGDWPEHGERSLPYEVVVGSFSGDWYAAADLYRDWSLRQHWAERPLHRREDVPDWLRESPPHIILRIQGELDIGPTEPNEDFLPYSKSLPLLDRLAGRIEAPLVPVIMSWERPGPWIYPDCFPPAGGEASLREFTALARERGWHIGTFCNGTRWVVGHFWSGYDGRDDFEARGGEQSVCRTHDGALWPEAWDATWRPSYAGCLGTSMTRDLATEFVRTVLDYGLDWIQFFDQNIGCSTFPCFAEDHDHPPVPGRWMTERMQATLADFHALAEDARIQSSGERQVVLSVEGPINELFLQEFQICDIRVAPPNHKAPHAMWASFVPLYHYLYHEFVVIQGGFGSAPEPYHLPIRNAYNLVVGEIPGAVIKGDGELLNLDTMNWAPWDIKVGSEEHAVAMLRAATLLRRGPAAPFLLYGRMQPPARTEHVEVVRWQHGGRDNEIAAVFDSAWLAPDGRHGVVLANWTADEQAVEIVDQRLGERVLQHVAQAEVTSATLAAPGGRLTLRLPPLSCVLLEPVGDGTPTR